MQTRTCKSTHFLVAITEVHTDASPSRVNRAYCVFVIGRNRKLRYSRNRFLGRAEPSEPVRNQFRVPRNRFRNRFLG
ncbi:hypothetical protein E2C01_024154 [Portunus trituberculatus]|uniref:Uncharacterized protein n=1 Tax=Portunus trituberculatus TaxID=210409 RepID=A0A5B7E9X6_PORTR|nr:hypothetical protein [Portunus trituberculatus]